MVKFLINRPIAVTMSFIAILVLGVMAARKLPVSLMPNVDIPKITVQVSAKDLSAREIEDAVTSQLRLHLMQVAHLSDIRSETRDGSAIIRLDFSYGTDIDFAFIEVNEKIDRAMSSLPHTVDRPRVIKANATDIPVFYLNLTLKERDILTAELSNNFIELSNFASQVIRKRIEQLPEVAMVDISGEVFTGLFILPDSEKLIGLGIDPTFIKQALQRHNITLGNLVIRDGQYQYNVRFGSTLRDKQDIENVYFKHEGRLLQIKDIARVIEQPQKRKGMVISDGRDAITMAVVQQSDAKMSELKDALNWLIFVFEKDYPHIDFTITRDQTHLLDFSLHNLRQNLLFGAILAFVVMFFFLKDFKSPLLIGITIPASLLISLLFFHLAGISINIISLSGLILSVGMMIDNSIIVIDNITQYRERGSDLSIACIHGTKEVFRPMLSATLTTCVVFIPLIFIGGISGALFYDQALAVSIGLLVSLAVSVTLLPVYYRLSYNRNTQDTKKSTFLERINQLDYARLYEKGFYFTMKRQEMAWCIIILMLVSSFFLFKKLTAEKLPPITHSETLLRIDWNDRINLDENNARVQQLIRHLGTKLEQSTSMIGEQQFMLDHESSGSYNEALVYLKAHSPAHLDSVYSEAENWLRKNYSGSLFHFEDAGNIFDQLFGDIEPPLIIRLRPVRDFGPKRNQMLQKTVTDLRHGLPNYQINPIAWQKQLVVKIDPELMTLYGINFDQAYNVLKRAFSANEILLITNNQRFIPVILGDRPRLINEIIANATVLNDKGEQIRLNSLFRQHTEMVLETIVAGQEGEFFPVPIEVSGDKIPEVTAGIRDILNSEKLYEASFSGSWFTNQTMFRELTLILIISLLLLYFIMASQFESLTLPLIVLAEVPLALFGVSLLLVVFGQSINLMSMIGIVVMSGIIINDSILKIDTINQLRSGGYSLMKALVVAGQRRLKPILMTSITTILAITPMLFTEGMGSDLQRPLSYCIIGGMITGTIVSIYFIPLGYYYLMKRSGKKEKQ